MKERSPGPLGMVLAVPAAVSLAAWAFEEISALVPSLGTYGRWASFAGLALDSCILGLGLALLVLRIAGTSGVTRDPWIEVLSSLPVIALSSAPLVYAFLEGRPEAIPAALLAVRSLRLFRLRRILPDASAGILAILAACELFRALTGTVLADADRYAASVRLLLLPEALLLVGAAAMGTRRPGAAGSGAASETGTQYPVVGEDELAGLLGKKGPW